MMAAAPYDFIGYDTHRTLYGTSRHYPVTKRTSRTDNFPCSLVVLFIDVVTGRTVEYYLPLAIHLQVC